MYSISRSCFTLLYSIITYQIKMYYDIRLWRLSGPQGRNPTQLEGSPSSTRSWASWSFWPSEGRKSSYILNPYPNSSALNFQGVAETLSARIALLSLEASLALWRCFLIKGTEAPGGSARLSQAMLSSIATIWVSSGSGSTCKRPMSLAEVHRYHVAAGFWDHACAAWGEPAS